MDKRGVSALPVVVAGLLLAGCDRQDRPAASEAAGSVASSTQPTPVELANIREFVRQTRTHGLDLPEGHPPVGSRLTRQASVAEDQAAAGPRLTYAVPAGWQKEPVTHPLRFEQYRLPHVEGDPEDAVLTVFGPGIGGSVEANLRRWRDQFSTPDGRPVPDEAFHREVLEIAGLKITMVDVAGSYRGSPGSPSSPPLAGKTNYRMLAAIVEAPDRTWYFKLVGPAQTLERHRAGFLALLHSLKSE